MIPSIGNVADSDAVNHIIDADGALYVMDRGYANKTKIGGWMQRNVHFLVLTRKNLRYKFMEWQDRPFTTKDAIRCHENAFSFFGGRTEEIVYDQDHLLSVSEYAGDIVLTAEFQAYVKDQKFRVHLCRKADPESKGMIVNVVKYIMGNFADSRVFKDIEDWNERALQWLERMGNKNVHIVRFFSASGEKNLF